MRFAVLKTIFLIFSTSLLAVSSALAQVYGMASLEGVVVDEQTQQPVVGALILVESIGEGQIQQQQKIGPMGTFRFTLDPRKNYYIRTEASGYKPTQEKLIFTSSYATRLYGKMILLKKGGPPVAMRVSPTAQPTPAVSLSPVVSTPATVSTTPSVALPQLVSATTTPPTAATRAEPVRSPSLTATGRLAPVSAPVPPVSLTARTRPVIPAPPITVSTVQTQLRAVQFVQSRAELVPDSQPALYQLLTFMQENPNVSIELAGHTDNQGNFDENLTLSRQRVDLVKTFLVQHGIPANRISSRGYGSTRPVASNNSEATRRLNRRVELIILTK